MVRVVGVVGGGEGGKGGTGDIQGATATSCNSLKQQAYLCR